MGQFSFACACCGEKEQFDWTNICVAAFEMHPSWAEDSEEEGEGEGGGDDLQLPTTICSGCPEGCDLAKATLCPLEAGGMCDVCEKEFREGDTVWQCVDCDYHKCKACVVREAKGEANAKDDRRANSP